MNFKEASKKKNYYHNQSELLESNDRSKLWENNKLEIAELYKELYFLYEIKDLFFVNDFIDKSIPFIDKIHLMFELNKENFEDLVDSHLLEKYSEGVKYYCRVDADIFLFEDSIWRKYEEKIHSVLVE
jgi:hypothetical protein